MISKILSIIIALTFALVTAAKDYDVVVAGGGPAGIGAGYMAAKRGAKVLVLERAGRLGGMAVQALVNPWPGGVDSPTTHQIIRRLGHPHTIDFQGLDVKAYDLLKEAGADVLLHTTVLAPLMDGRRVVGVRVQCEEGERTFPAKVVIDATGNGMVAAAAGVPYEIGRKGDGLVQPVSVMFAIDGIEPGKRFLSGSEESARRIKIGGKTWEAIVQEEIAARKQAFQVTDVLRRRVPGYKNVRIAQMPAVVGVRESRRFEGVARLEKADCLAGRHFPDAIVRKANFVIDIHNPAGAGQAVGHDTTVTGEAERVRPYDIPYGALVPKKVDGLLLAGRCISASHEALASCRVMRIAMATGVGAGAAAAYAVKNNIDVRTVSAEKLALFSK